MTDPARDLEARARQAERAAALAAALVSTSRDALVLVTPAGRIESLNPAAEQLLRLPAHQALGARIGDVFPGTSPRLLLGTGRVEAQRGDGAPFLAEVTGAEVTHDGEARLALSVRDVSAVGPAQPAEDEATLSAEKHQRSAILSATSDGMLLVDPSGVVAYANGRFAELVGIDVDELDGETAGALAQRLRERGPDPRQAFDRLLLGADRSQTVAAARCALGGRTLRLAMSPVFRDEGAFLGSLLVVRDVTVEEKVQRAKEELIGNVSHELRTPLTSIRGFVDLLRTSRAGPVTAKQKEFLEIIAENVTRLTALVADLLEVDRVAHVPVTSLRVELAPLLRDALAVEEANAVRKDLTVTLEAPDDLEVLGDPDRLRQVFGNLLSNAVKYTAQGGVTVRAERVDGERVRVEVEDTGIGIGAADRGQLFQRFFRAADPSVRAAGGTGLGLSIVKTLIERQQGTIEVESEPGRGSCFRVLLPSPRGARPRGDRGSSSYSLKRLTRPSQAPRPGWPRVLAIDPDAGRQRLYQAVLRAASLEAIPAPDWARAQEVADEGAPDLVLVAADVLELEESGSWRALQKEPRLAGAPLVVVITPEEVGRALRAGVDGLVTKPLEAGALRAEVERVLALRRAP
jgi:PAS domain S-box-containing protein